MSVEVVVPFLGGCAHRERAWNYLEPLYEWPVTIAHGGSPWVKAEAVMPAVAASDAEIIVVADADCHTNGLPEAIQAVKDGAPWSIPHAGVFRLHEKAMDDFYAGADPADLPLAQPAYRGYPGGGFVVARRATLLDIPLDPRFIGWGHEDNCWAWALSTLVGRPWRGKSPLIHLWHPPQERPSRRHGSPQSMELERRYQNAHDKPDLMRELIGEIHRDYPDLDKSRLHGDPAI